MGPISKEPLSYQGAVLIHDNRDELQWLYPKNEVKELPGNGLGRPLMRLKYHPDMQSVEWPICKSDFL